MTPLPPRIVVTPASTLDIEALARGLVAIDPAEVDRMVAAHVASAIRERRIDDAIRWQRVRLRARSLRQRGAG